MINVGSSTTIDFIVSAHPVSGGYRLFINGKEYLTATKQELIDTVNNEYTNLVNSLNVDTIIDDINRVKSEFDNLTGEL